MAAPGPPSAPPQYSPDGRWWWNGQRWQPVAAAPRGSLRSNLLVLGVFAGILGVAVVIGLVVAASRTGSRETAEYLAVTQRDATGLQARQQAVADCFDVQPSPVPCRPQLQALDDQLAGFQRDLDRHPAPACLRDSDRELRLALRGMRLSTQMLLQAGPLDVARINDATSTLDGASAHLRTATALRSAARC